VQHVSGRRRPSSSGSRSPGLLEFDESRRAGRALLAGLDEAGRGPLAGPLVVAAAILPPGLAIPGVDDSKKLRDRARRKAFEAVQESAICWATGLVEPHDIDLMGISRATRTAFERALGGLSIKPDICIIDGLPMAGLGFAAGFVVRGDSRSLSVAAASVLAKVTRDTIMIEADRLWPGYGFASNKGYGSPEHMEALRRLGPCPLHRLSFAPLSSPGLFD